LIPFGERFILDAGSVKNGRKDYRTANLPKLPVCLVLGYLGRPKPDRQGGRNGFYPALAEGRRTKVLPLLYARYNLHRA